MFISCLYINFFVNKLLVLNNELEIALLIIIAKDLVFFIPFYC